jgi:FkbM family methyltransferase
MLKRLRPAVRRRWFAWRLGQIPVEPYAPLVRLGTDYGGWVVPEDLIDESWTCYCVGAGSDVSFDMALLRRYGVTVRSVDPLPEFRRQAEAQAAGDSRFAFFEAALATRDGPLEMYGFEDPEAGSYSQVDLYETRHATTMPGRTLESLMAEAGDARADLLKLDIEGSEYDVLRELDLARLGVRVLCVELHASESAGAGRELLERVRSQGYRLVHREPPTDFTFVRDHEGSSRFRRSKGGAADPARRAPSAGTLFHKEFPAYARTPRSYGAS